MHHVLSGKDLLIGPIVLVLLLVFTAVRRFTKYKNISYGRFFISAIALRFLASIVQSLIAEYYYGGGDTFHYFEGTSIMYNHIVENWKHALPILTAKTAFEVNNLLGITYYDLPVAFLSPSYMVMKISTVFSFLTFNSYMGNAMLFGLFSFYGCWRIFQVFAEEFPKYEHWFAYTILFFPSFIFWGTGILKDPLSIFFFGQIVYHSHQLFIKGKNIPVSIIWLVVAGFFISAIKPYVLFIYLPVFTLTTILYYKNKIQSVAFRVAFFASFAVVLSIGIYSLFNSLNTAQGNLSQYGTEKSTERIVDLAAQYDLMRDQFKDYDLGLGSVSSPADLIAKVPKAISYSLFHPLPWEASNPLMLMSVAESMFVLASTIFLLFVLGFKGIYRAIKSNILMQISFWYSLLFLSIVAFVTANYGTLVRYKIPGMLFYMAFITMLYIYYKENKKEPLTE